MSGLIWIQAVWQSDGIPEIFFFFLKKVTLKNPQMAKMYTELPSMQKKKKKKNSVG